MVSGGWLTVREAARIIGVSQPTLRKWTDDGRIPAFKTPGGHRRYLRSEVQEFQASREEERLGDPWKSDATL
jgi:excisionase family DNA binding protein